jgi:hypothetical protein
MALMNTEKTCTPIEHLFLMEMYEEDSAFLLIGESDSSIIDNLMDTDKEVSIFDDEIVEPDELDEYGDDDSEDTFDGDDYFAFDIDDEDDIDALI